MSSDRRVVSEELLLDELVLAVPPGTSVGGGIRDLDSVRSIGDGAICSQAKRLREPHGDVPYS